MFHRIRRGLLLLAALCAFGTTVSAQGYRVDDLGALDGNTSWAWAINDRGDVAGWSSAGVENEAFIAKPSTGMRGLGRLPHTRASYALGVNDAGLATGYSGLAFETVRSFAWTAARGLVDLGSLGGASSWARALNNRGQIVGESETGDGEIHMFRWSAGRMADLGTPPGERFAQAESISDVGHVAGNAGGPFLWRNGVFTPLPSLGGFGLVHDVNDFGAAVGSSALGDGACSTCETRAALWANGTVRNLGLLAPPDAAFMTSVAHSINNLGEAVGWSTTSPSGSHHAFYCARGCPEGLVDLNDRVPAGWHIAEAYAINDAGQIAAVGSLGTGGHVRALRLTPDAPTLVLLAPRPGRADAHNRFELRWGTPGETAVVLAANGPGNAGFAPCGLALDIAAAREVGRAAADAQGVGVFSGFVGAARAGQPIYFQAVELNTCRKSAIAVQTFE